MQQVSRGAKPRIALLAPGGLAEQQRGVHIPSLYRIISALSKEFEVTVYSLVTFESDLESTTCGDAIVHLVPSRFDDHWLKKFIVLTRRLLLDHRTKPFHLVHAMLGLIPELSAIVFSKVTRIPCMVSLFGGETANLPSINYGSFRNPVLRTITRFIIKHADLVSVLTNFQQKQLDALHLKPRALMVIPHGLDRKAFTPAVKKIPHHPVRFLHVGSLTPVKDQRTLLDAFAAIHSIIPGVLRVVGADYLDGSVQRYARTLGLDDAMQFVGFIPHPEIRRQYHWADVLLHTSLHEGQGVVFVEAAGTKTLIAGTRVGLLHDFSDEMAVRVSVGDAGALAEGVVNVLRKPHLLRSMIERSYRWAVAHDSSKSIQSYSEAYHSLLENSE